MAHWTEENHKIIITILTMVIMIFIGIYIKDLSIGSKVHANEQGITANTSEIKFIKETFNEHLTRIDNTIKSYDEKMGAVQTDIAGIKTYIETTK